MAFKCTIFAFLALCALTTASIVPRFEAQAASMEEVASAPDVEDTFLQETFDNFDTGDSLEAQEMEVSNPPVSSKS